ncbi:TPA: hypothetical protein ACGFUW_002322 [Flavobacterium psychrophilum]
MKKIKFLFIAIISLTTFSCSKSDSNSTATVDAPTTLNPSDYTLKNPNGTTACYVYFGDNISFSSGNESSELKQGSFTNKINYTYNKPNGTILVGPKTSGSPTSTTTLVFKENFTYPFSISGQSLTITANGQNYILTKEP